MDCKVNGVPVHYAEYGTGTPVLALHGAGVDHREIAGALEPLFRDRPGYRRLYPDLPGMGRTPAPATIASNDDVVELILGLVDNIIGAEQFVIIGQSYGGYLARAIANRRPERAVGLALICPVGDGARDTPEHRPLVASDDLRGAVDPDLETTYRNYFVVQTTETLRRFQEHVAPSAPLVDESGLARIFEQWQLSQRPEDATTYPGPTLILTGRQDATAGYASPWDLVEHYPRATFVVLDRAGHALLHEQPDLAHALVADWLTRVLEHANTARDGRGRGSLR
jgi:pimeloyl-ACP methyl ester carboxylesterase